jgi:hypothetical protein
LPAKLESVLEQVPNNLLKPGFVGGDMMIGRI